MKNLKMEAIASLAPNTSFSLLTDGTIRSEADAVNNLTESAINAKLAELIAAEPIRLLREKRNALLAESDWTGLSDSAFTNEQAAKWKLYRQKLRDLPDGLNTPAKVKSAKWPTAPG